MYKPKNYYTLIKEEGIWKYYCYTESGKRVKRSTGRKKRAEALEVIEERIKADCLIWPRGFVKPKTSYVYENYDAGTTMNEFCRDLFIYEKCPIVREKLMRGKHFEKSSCASMRQYLTSLILPFLGRFRVAELDRKTIDAWLLALPSERAISNTTANIALKVLNSILSYAKSKDLIPTNPCKDIERLAEQKKEKPVPNDNDINLLFSKPWESEMVRECCFIAANTGMRIGEIIALQGYQIKDDYILVDANETRLGYRKAPKNGKARKIPISKELRNSIVPFIRGADEYLFTINGNSHVVPQTIYSKLYAQLKKIGLGDKGFTFHSFRHYFNTKLVAADINPEKIRAIVGHSSEAMTEHYLHLSVEDLREITELQK